MPGPITFTFEVNDQVSGAMDAISATFDKAFGKEKTLAKFGAGLGQTKETTELMGKLAREVWVEGWGESLEDVTNAIGAVGSQMVDLGGQDTHGIGKLTKAAIDLAEVMEVDVTEVTRAAGQMMKNGLADNAMQAFDIIATGAQNGANRSGDLLDVLTEYAPSFSALGIDGPTALGLLNQALDAGIFTADKAADAINEFGIRAIDGSKGTSDAYAALGLNADEMASKIAAGGPTAQSAFSQIVQALGTMTDPVAQETAGVALFGSMWEDSGAKSILAMDPVLSKTGDVKGATEEMGLKLNDVATTKVETIKRKFDEWVGSMIATEGPFGDITAFVAGFGPQAISLAGSVAMIALALKGVGVAAWGAVAGMGSLAIASAPLLAIAAAVGAVIALVDTAIKRIDVLRTNWEGLVTGDASKASSFGTFRNLGRQGSLLGVFGSGVGTPGGIWGHAAGGIVTRPHLAMVGEGGEPEVILPLSKMADMLAAGGGGQPVTVNVYGSVIQETDLARTVQEAVAKARRQGAIPAGGF